MANSKIISDIKDAIIKALVDDPEIVSVIDAPDVDPDEADQLIGKQIFRYNQNPNTIKQAQTFITVIVDLIQNYYNKHFVIADIEIGIYSHESRMDIKDRPGIIDNRNDYLSILIDKKFNGKYLAGFGEMELYENREGSLVTDYLYRRLTFNIQDINDTMCDDDDEIDY